MVDIFIRSHFNSNEKRKLFFHEKPWICHTYHKPREKARINTDDFSNGHRRLIYTCPRNQHAPHEPPAPAPSPHGPPAPAPAPAPPQANDFVTRAEFNVLQNTVNQLNINVNQLNINVNQLTNKVNQLTNKVNQLANNVNQLANNVNQLTNNIA